MGFLLIWTVIKYMRNQTGNSEREREGHDKQLSLELNWQQS